jgi:hypothetical protein
MLPRDEQYCKKRMEINAEIRNSVVKNNFLASKKVSETNL